MTSTDKFTPDEPGRRLPDGVEPTDAEKIEADGLDSADYAGGDPIDDQTDAEKIEADRLDSADYTHRGTVDGQSDAEKIEADRREP